MKGKSSGRRYRSAGEWREIINRQVESGETVQHFCERESICEQSFFRWRKKLGTQAPQLPTKFIELKPTVAAEPIVRVELRMPNGTVLRIG